MNRLQTLSPTLERELISKWSLSRSYLNEFGYNNNGFITLSKNKITSSSNNKINNNLLKQPASKTHTNNSGRNGLNNKNKNEGEKDKEENITLLVDPSMNPPIRMVANNRVFGSEYIRGCLLDAHKYRKGLEKKLDTGNQSAYRLIHETGDGLPGLAIDVYAGYIQIHLYSLFWKPYLREISSILLNELKMIGVYVKHRIRGRPQVSRHYAGDKAEENKVIVKENGLSFQVHLTDPHSTGLFLDMRCNRKSFYDIIKQHFKDNKISVLNTFCHTCSFSVYAASLSAATTNVDMAAEYLDWGKQNFKLNNLSLNNQTFLAQDVLSYSSSLSSSLSSSSSSSSNQFHAVILDPPSFLHTTPPPEQEKRKEKSQKTQHKKGKPPATPAQRTGETYAALAQRMAALVRKGGLLFAFANTRDVSRDTWVRSVEECVGITRNNNNDNNNNNKNNENKENIKEEGKDNKREKGDNKYGEWQTVCELQQDVDFRYKEGDVYGNYLKGIVLKKIS